MSKRREAIPARKFGPAAVAVEAYLRGLGVSDIEFIKTKHVQVSWKLGSRSCSLSLPCSPRDDDVAVKQSLRRVKAKLTEALVQANA